jgi:histone deacetylase complex regulatory component SIN3
MSGAHSTSARETEMDVEPVPLAGQSSHMSHADVVKPDFAGGEPSIERTTQSPSPSPSTASMTHTNQLPHVRANLSTGLLKALRYSSYVKAQLADQPGKYERFLVIMRGFSDAR